MGFKMWIPLGFEWRERGIHNVGVPGCTIKAAGVLLTAA